MSDVPTPTSAFQLWPGDFRYQRAEFLTAAEVPENLLRLKPGDKLQWHTPRRVIRVGYRKSAQDYMDEAKKRLNSPASRSALLTLTINLGLPPAGLDLQHPVARALAAKDGLGGPERGIWVQPRIAPEGEPEPLDLAPITVKSTYCVRLGTYYPPGGSGEDYEDGGLSSPRTVVLVVSTCGTTFISGDLRRIP